MNQVFIPIEKLIGALTDRLYELEEKLFNINEVYNLEEAEGKQLDFIGYLVGMPRITASDETYKLYIKAQIILNSSKGRINDLLSALDLLAGESSYIIIYAMGLDLYADVDYDTAVFIKQKMQEAVMAGVKILTVQPVNDGCFGFLGSENSDTFGTIHDPEIGGNFSSIIV